MHDFEVCQTHLNWHVNGVMLTLRRVEVNTLPKLEVNIVGNLVWLTLRKLHNADFDYCQSYETNSIWRL